MSQNLSSAAVVIGALRAKLFFFVSMWNKDKSTLQRYRKTIIAILPNLKKPQLTE